MIYNFFFKYIGGFEYETKDNEVSNSNPQFWQLPTTETK
jgi:hypothetical protein